MDSEKVYEKADTLGLEHTANLFSLATSYEWQDSPYSLFLDLTGIFKDEFGDDFSLYTGENDLMRPFELGYIGKALVEYSDKPDQVRTLVLWIDEQERAENEA